ncbi:MAG: serine/threonine-protein kinase, partial [Planctomycetota bacterium]
MQAAADDLIGREIGGYRVEALLGVGGMGRVYRAEQQRLRRTVAFKVVRGEHARDSTFRERLLLEAYTAARVEHPNVVTIYDAGEADDLLYIAMQLVSGGDLHRLSRAGAVGLRETIEVGAAVSRALQAAWNEGIVHLDIKPANILRATDGTWKVADFGLARSVGAALVDPAKASADDVDEEELGLCGTPAYMALEQWEGRRPDVRTDLYALGVTLFQLLGGEHPLEVEHGAAPFAYYERLRRGRRRPLGSRAPEAPRPLVELIEQLLERDPDRRPRSAVVVAQLFERILAGLDRTDFNVPVTRAHTHGLAAELSPGQVGTAGTSAGAPEAAPGQGASSRASRGREAPLRGRIAEVELLRQRVRALLEGGGGALAFRGVRGVGRTRVLRVAGSLARSHGLRAIGGRARPRQAASALRDLLLDLLRNEDPAAGESLSLARTRRELERATENGLDIVLAALPEGSADARSILRPLLLGQPLRSDGPGLPARALGGLLAHYATSTRPLIVALDGLEHACGATLSVAACLREAARNKPILLLMSALDGPVGDDALARVTEVGEVEQHTVQPLDDEAMHAIVADALGRKPHEVSGPALEAIVRVARGLPKIAVATVKNGLRLSRLALREGRLEVESLANLESLASAIADRLAKTSPRAPAGAPSSARPPALPPNLAGQVRYYERRIAQALRLRSFHDHRGAI